MRILGIKLQKLEEVFPVISSVTILFVATQGY